MATSNYEGFVFRLSGVTTSSGGTIPTGTGLEKVILTTRDLISRATAAAQLNDAQGLISGESTTFQVNPRPMAAAMNCPRRRRHSAIGHHQRHIARRDAERHAGRRCDPGI